MILLSVSHPRPTRAWMDRFSDQLMQLVPGTNPVDATRQARASYFLDPSARPEAAAERHVASLTRPDEKAAFGEASNDRHA